MPIWQTSTVLAAVCYFFLAVSTLALLVKWTHWSSYGETILKHPFIVRLSRYLSYLDAAAAALLALDRFVLKLAYVVHAAVHAESNPTGTLSSMVYMAYNQRSLFVTGVWTTVQLALAGTAIAFVLALLMVFLRIQEPDKRNNDFVKIIKIVANKFARFYIFVIRGTPMMVQAMFLYYGLQPIIGWDGPTAGLFVISINTGAYMAEIVRGGILSIDKGQFEAAHSIGMSHTQTMRSIILPQVIRIVLPPVSNETINLVKDTSLIYILAMNDLLRVARTIVQREFDMTPFLIAGIFYLAMTFVLTWMFKRLEAYYGKYDK